MPFRTPFTAYTPAVFAAAVVACTPNTSSDAVAPAEATDVSATSAELPKTPEQTEQPPSTVEKRNQVETVLTVDGEGLRLFDPVTTSASPIPFGRSQSSVIDTLERFRGPPGQGTNQDCGAGPVDYASWPDGLSLVFKDDRFVGWGLDGRSTGAIFTVGSVGPGSTRRQLDETYSNVLVRKTSLGNEFTAGGFAGVLDGPNVSSKITDMWAGTSCVAR